MNAFFWFSAVYLAGRIVVIQKKRGKLLTDFVLRHSPLGLPEKSSNHLNNPGVVYEQAEA